MDKATFTSGQRSVRHYIRQRQLCRGGRQRDDPDRDRWQQVGQSQLRKGRQAPRDHLRQRALCRRWETGPNSHLIGILFPGLTKIQAWAVIWKALRTAAAFLWRWEGIAL